MKTTIILLFAINILDVVSTYFSVESGRGYESTYLVDLMIKNGGYSLFLIVKIVVISIVSVILIKVSKIPHETINFERAIIISTNVINAFMLYVVINNFYIAFAGWNNNNHPIVIPNSVTSIGSYAFNGWFNIPYTEMKSATPPTLANINAFNSQNDAPIYVPDDSVDDYKTATQWVNLASRIFSINDK